MKLFSRKNVDLRDHVAKQYMAVPVNCATVESYYTTGTVNCDIYFRYYHTVSPVASAIDKITDSLVDIPVRFRELKDNEPVDDVDVLRLLKKPNCFQSYRDFIKELSTNFLVAGNTFLKLTGDINKPPLEIFNVSPCRVSPVVGSDGIVDVYNVSLNGVTQTSYHRLIEFSKSNCIRYVTTDRKSELLHIRDFTNEYNYHMSYYGVSKMQAMFSEIEQLVKANVFNYSTLVRSSNISLAIIAKTPLNQAELEAVKASIHNQWSGAERAGQVAFMAGDDLEIKELSKSPRDMEFSKLKDELTKIIYLRYNIPLALIDDKVMTFNNLATASIMLYDNAVIPLARTILNAFNTHILPRYQQGDGGELFINLRDITALESRQNERVKVLGDIGVLTQNELRVELGYESIEGGDVLPLNAIKAIKHFDKSDTVRQKDIKDLYDY